MSSAEDKFLAKRSFSATLTDYYQLTKPGITFAVLISMLVGFVAGSAGTIKFVLMVHALIGTWFIAGGTAAHNMFMERNLDGLMDRTKTRPLPDSRITARNGQIFSLTMIFTGLTYLVLAVNPVAGMVSFTTTLIYLAAYTPMKRISAVNIVIGAVPGALPPVGGWAAATGSVSDPGMWLLFGILFLWQVPHVMAIAWMCKEDYEGAGFKMLPKGDTTGSKTAFYAILCTILLFPTSTLLYVLNYSGLFFLISGLLLAVGFLGYAIQFSLNRTRETARKLMFASIAYLPLIWVVFIVDYLF